MTQQVTDPWAAAAGQTAQQSTSATSNGATQSTAQPAQQKDLGGITDPFGTASEYAASGSGGGQAWDPRVPFDEIADRTVIMVPRSFDPAAEDRFNPGKTREEYRVDLVIVDGEPFSFTAKVTVRDDEGRAVKAADGSYVKEDKEIKVESLPATFRQQSVAQGILIKLLKGIDAAPDKLFAVGVLKRAPQERDKPGFTIESIEESRQRYIESVKRGKMDQSILQRHTWNLVDDPKYFTPERMQRARAWWKTAKTTWPNL